MSDFNTEEQEWIEANASDPATEAEFLRERLRIAIERAEAAEDKLAKAVTSLQHIAANKNTDELTRIEWDTHDTFNVLDACILPARITLAELKGETDE